MIIKYSYLIYNTRFIKIYSETKLLPYSNLLKLVYITLRLKSTFLFYFIIICQLRPRKLTTFQQVQASPISIVKLIQISE